MCKILHLGASYKSGKWKVKMEWIVGSGERGVESEGITEYNKIQ